MAIIVSGPKARQKQQHRLVFRLGGKTTLPDDEQDLPPATPPTEKWARPACSAAARFIRYIVRCHGVGNYTIGVLPDLRRSGALTDENVWRQIIIDGILKDQGMVSFADLLTPADAESIRAYVGTNAQALNREEKSGSR